ncbi:SOS response-associated peptidase [Dehalococcoidia bacterium]|nr:SOS response-associated peptidase [Dehalococcoidia bacterium]
MCGRYTLFSNLETIVNRFSVTDNPIHPPTKNYNVHPGQNVLTILRKGEDISAEMMKWGFKPDWDSVTVEPKTIHNSRIESLLTKSTFKSIVKRQRCLIPTNGFYEWKKSIKGKVPFFIHTQRNELFAFAGIWTSEIDDDGAKINSCSIVTKAANLKLTSIHSRMPVIVAKGMETHWLNEHSHPPDLVDNLLSERNEPNIYADIVSDYVNSTKHSGEDCITPRPRLL